MAATHTVLPQLRVHHVSVSVPDLDVALAWYDSILGFSVEKRFDIAAIPARAAFVARGALRIEIWEAGGGAAVPRQRREPNSDLKEGGTKHVAFAVADLASCLARLEKMGVDIAAVQRDPHAPMAAPDGRFGAAGGTAFAAFIRDPGGTLIELLDLAQVGE
jgi:methylmalonyl-CoA/ethylmalonyl-CoA epimerase